MNLDLASIPDTHPLLLHNLKAQTSPEQYMRSTVTVLDGYGSKGAKPRPYKKETAIREFCSWFHAAVGHNSKAVQATRLRMYVPRSHNQKSSWEFGEGKAGIARYKAALAAGEPVNLFMTKPARLSNPKHYHYLMGRKKDRPSPTVMRKIAEFGQDFEEVTEPHPALTLLAKPNPLMTGNHFGILRMDYLQVMGDSYVHPVIDPTLDIPVALWPMPAQWMKLVMSRTEGVSGYVYGRAPDEQRFELDEVIRWRMSNPADPISYGYGYAEALWTALGLHNARRTEDLAKSENHSRPDWMLIYKTGATPESLDRLETKIESKFSGSRNAGKFLTVTGDAEAVPLNFEVSEIGTPESIIREIAAVTGCPLYKLLGNDPIKANSEIQDVGWMRDTILPMCRDDEEVLNTWYLPLFGIEDDAVLGYDNPVPENEGIAVELSLKEIAGGKRTINEVRADDGEEPVEGGDTLLVPNTLTTLDLIINPPKPPAPVMPGADKPAPNEDAAKILDVLGEIKTAVDDVLAASNEETDEADDSEKENGRGAGAGEIHPVASGIPQGPKAADPAPPVVVAGAGGEPENKVEVIDGKASGDVAGLSDGGSRSQRTPAGSDDDHLQPASAGDTIRHRAAQARKEVPEVAPPLPQGYELVPILRKVFAQQMAETMEQVKGKSLADIESKFGDFAAAQEFCERMNFPVKNVHDYCALFNPKSDAHPRLIRKDDIAPNDGAEDRRRGPRVNDQGLPTRFIPLSQWDERLAAAVQPTIELFARRASRQIASRIGATPDVFSVVDRNLRAASQRLSLDFAQSTNQTTSLQINEALAKLRDEIEAGTVEGDTIPELQSRVRGVFENASESRAETIARTEASRARHTGQLETAKESGAVTKKNWLASLDACPICMDIVAEYPDGVPLDGNFGETEYGPIECPPGHPNCQCSMTFSLATGGEVLSDAKDLSPEQADIAEIRKTFNASVARFESTAARLEQIKPVEVHNHYHAPLKQTKVLRDGEGLVSGTEEQYIEPPPTEET